MKLPLEAGPSEQRKCDCSRGLPLQPPTKLSYGFELALLLSFKEKVKSYRFASRERSDLGVPTLSEQDFPRLVKKRTHRRKGGRGWRRRLFKTAALGCSGVSRRSLEVWAFGARRVLVGGYLTITPGLSKSHTARTPVDEPQGYPSAPHSKLLPRVAAPSLTAVAGVDSKAAEKLGWRGARATLNNYARKKSGHGSSSVGGFMPRVRL